MIKARQKISPYKFKGKNSYAATFFHPLLGRRTSFALGTKLEPVARRICEGLVDLCANPDSQFDAQKIDQRAWLIFFKHDPVRLAEADSIIEMDHIQKLIEMGREVCPNLSKVEIAELIQLTYDHAPFDIAESVPFIGMVAGLAPLVKLLKDQGVSDLTFEALKNLVQYCSAEILRERKRTDDALAKLAVSRKSEERLFEELHPTDPPTWLDVMDVDTDGPDLD